ncbi:MAG: hypothetical protein ACI9JL_003614 [Paracoccaceae bacterium]
MTILGFIRNTAAATILTVGMTASANAAMITFNQAQTFISPPELLVAEVNQAAIIDGVSGTRNGSFNLARFDSSLGTLNRVILNVAHAINSEFVDIGGTCIGTNATCGVDIQRSYVLGSGYNAGSTVNGGLTGVAGSSLSSCDLGGSCLGFTDNRDFSSNGTRFFIQPGDLADFTGPGDFTVDVDMFFRLSVLPGTGTDTVLLGASFDWDGVATVTYEYTEASTQVPAPAGAAFLAIGLAALVLRKRA